MEQLDLFEVVAAGNVAIVDGEICLPIRARSGRALELALGPAAARLVLGKLFRALVEDRPEGLAVPPEAAIMYVATAFKVMAALDGDGTEVVVLHLEGPAPPLSIPLRREFAERLRAELDATLATLRARERPH